MTNSGGTSGRALRYGAVVAGLVAAFLAGTWVGAHQPEVAAWWAAAPPELAVPNKPEEDEGPQKVLEKVAAEVARLSRRETDLTREVREASVAINLLMVRGLGPDAPARREQEEKRRAASEELERARREKAEAVKLEGELRQALRAPRAEGARMDRETERRARVWILRRELLRQGGEK